jgi:hypothetical protein
MKRGRYVNRYLTICQIFFLKNAEKFKLSKLLGKLPGKLLGNFKKLQKVKPFAIYLLSLIYIC